MQAGKLKLIPVVQVPELLKFFRIKVMLFQVRQIAVYVADHRVGRCGHIANASYAVRGDCRGRGVGEALVRDSLSRARGFGFRAMQFNAVVAGNARARALYERIGFRCVGRVEGGFRLPDGRYEDIYLYVYPLT